MLQIGFGIDYTIKTQNVFGYCNTNVLKIDFL